MSLSQRKVEHETGQKGRSDLSERERDQERRVIADFSTKERKTLKDDIANTQTIIEKINNTGRIIPLFRKKIRALPDFGKDTDPYEIGTPEATVRFFLNEHNGNTNISDDILELYHDIFNDKYLSLQNGDIVNKILNGHASATDVSPSEFIAALFEEEMRERFLAEFRPSIEARFFENFASQFPQSSILMGSIWDNYRDKIHGIAERDEKGNWKHHHFIFYDDNVDEIISNFSKNGIESIPNRAQKILERPERDFINARRQAIRVSLQKIANKYDQLAQKTAISLSDRPWNNPEYHEVYQRLFEDRRKEKAFSDPGSMRAFVKEIRDNYDAKNRETDVSVQWKANKIGWLERFKPNLSEVFYNFCAHRKINARQLAHCIGAISTYSKDDIKKIYQSIEKVLSPHGKSTVLQWCAVLLTMGNDRSFEIQNFVKNWQAIFGAEPECVDKDITELHDNVIVLVSIDYCLRHVFSIDGASGGLFDEISKSNEIYSAIASSIKYLRAQEVYSLPRRHNYDETIKVSLSLSRHMRDALTKGVISNIDDDKKISKILKLFDNSRIMGVLSLSVFGGYIRGKEHNEQVAFVRKLLEQSLHPVFDEIGVAESDRPELIEDFTKRVLSLHLNADGKQALGPWAARVVEGKGEARTATKQISDFLPLPEDAPLIPWSERNKGESPVDFIQRVYGDRMGHDPDLTKSYIRRVDRPLDTALTRWIAKGNELPEWFDLPTKEEAVNRELEALKKGEGPNDTKEWRRLAQAQYRRERKAQTPSP